MNANTTTTATTTRKTRTSSSVSIPLDVLVAKLQSVPQLPVQVSRKWAAAAQTTLGVDLGVSDEVETPAVG